VRAPDESEIGDGQLTLLSIVSLCVLYAVDGVDLHLSAPGLEQREGHVETDLAVLPHARVHLRHGDGGERRRTATGSDDESKRLAEAAARSAKSPESCGSQPNESARSDVQLDERSSEFDSSGQAVRWELRKDGAL